MRALVTGASGFVGSAVARALVGAGADVRVLLRPDADTRGVHGLPVEVVHGDVRDEAGLLSAVRDCHHVYHVAALYKLWVRRKQEMYDCNVRGTENVLKAARTANVEKIVYTSSVATLGYGRDGVPATEETPVGLGDMLGHYKRSKFLAEQVVLAYAREGLPVVIVNPSTPVGLGDLKPTPTGRLIVDFLNGRMPGYVDTGLNLVDVDDVAQGHLLAAQHGTHGEKYILGNANLTLRRILELLAELSGRRAPRLKIPYALALAAAYGDAACARLVPGREPRIPPVGVRLSRKTMFFCAAKAVRCLGLPQTPVREALQKAVRWFEEHGYVKPVARAAAVSSR